MFIRGEGGRPGKEKGETWGGRGREIQLRGGGREGGEHGGVRDRKREREERNQGDTVEGGSRMEGEEGGKDRQG